MRRRPAGLLNTAAYWAMWGTLGPALRVWFRMQVQDRPRLRPPYVLAANHTSWLDPLLLGAASHRRLTFLMTEQVYRTPGMRWFYDWNRVVTVAVRGSQRDSMRAARAALDAGEIVAIFPEGGVSRDGLSMRGSPGAAALVLAAGVPLVPVGIQGAHAALPPHRRFPRPARIRVAFGAPIAPEQLAVLPAQPSATDRRARVQAATLRLMREIALLSGQRSREDVLAELARNAPAAS